MSDIRVASRYAKSLLELAREKEMLEEVHKDMLMFHRVCEANRDFVLMLKNPVIKHDKKLSILKAIFEGKVNKLTMAIFDIITRKNRESILPSLAREFHVQYNLLKKIGEASIVTAVPLTTDMRKKFQDMVLQISDTKSVELKEKVDDSIIGGFILTVGDKQIDDSIHAKLKSMGRKFAHNPFVKEI